jgi:hypothetical protein
VKKAILVPAISAALIVLMSSAAYASTYVAYEGRGFTGRTQVISDCGTTNIRYGGSYKWYGSGQDGRMYNHHDARGPVHFVLASNRNAEQVTGVGWKSIFIVC